MENIWVIVVALVIFLTIGFAFYKILYGYVRRAFGEKWLTAWGNKVYFWQTIIFVSTAGTYLILYILKWSNHFTHLSS